MIKNRIIELRQVKAGDLLENPRNWRTHPEAQRSALTAVLDEVGIAGALVGYETEDGLRLIDGHLRKEQDPEQEWPVLVLDVDDLEADKLLVTMDPLAAMADANEQVLADLIDSIDTDSDDLRKMLDDLASDNPLPTNGEVVEDEVPEAPKDPITKPGDLIQLGDHRVLCGDSTNADDVARLMNGERADVLFTDPPYGISFKAVSVGDFGKGERLTDTIANDHDTTVAKRAVDEWNDVATRMAVFFGANFYHDCLPNGGSWLVWNKLAYEKRNQTFNRCEIAWCTENSNSVKMYSHIWDGAFREGERSIELKSRVHPNQKPVGLTVAILQDYEAKSVCDLFLGSGTTLIACEQLGRKCYGMEIDPAYCDVIVQRWENLTSETATRQSLEAVM